jgi:glucosamine-6-phosphate deaminase
MNILLFESETSWVAGVATFWRDRLRSRPALKHCLASGNTPIPVYHEMVRAARQGDVSFRDAIVFALDEFGGLPAEDPGKCRHMLTRDLVKHVNIQEKNFRFFNPDTPDLEAECRAFDKQIGKGFDLVLLGIGLNGHLGMNEPGSAPDSPTRRVDLHATTISSSAKYLTHHHLPKWGLTVGMHQFFNSREVWLIATGPAKADIIRRVVRDEITTDVPASLMRRHPNCTLFVDAAAGSLL